MEKIMKIILMNIGKKKLRKERKQKNMKTIQKK